jgi:asparagine synthase (glutamine-hydrolysing)
MTESMRHELYYTSSQYVNSDIGLYAGWMSHSSPLARSMPLISRDRRYIVIMVGELFFPRNSASTTGDGGRDNTAADVLRLCEESGDQFLDRLNGWFSGLVVDLAQRKVTLFNDRFGMGRIYFHQGKDEFIFSSEAKSLLRVRPALRTLDPEALAQFLRFGCVMGDKSLFKGIGLLPAASSWSWTAARGAVTPNKKHYFDYKAWEQQPALPAVEFYQRFDETVARVFPAYSEASQPVALSLTAGLDTRLILASSCQNQLPCYTFGGEWGETFDTRIARKLAAIRALPHEVFRIDEHFLREFPTYAQRSVYISDGTHDVFGAHDVYFNQIARDIAPIRLTGKFGSEVVRIRNLVPAGDFPSNIVQPWIVPFLNNAPTFHQVSQRRHPLSRAVSEEIPWFEFGRVAVEQSQVVLRTPYMDNELVKLMYQAPLAVRASRDFTVKYVRDKAPDIIDVPTDLGQMASDSQFASKTIRAFYRALSKTEHIYLSATPHWLTRVDRSLGKLRLERVMAGRVKFENYRIWIKTHFADSIREILLNPQARCIDFFDKQSVARVVARHTAGTHNYLSEIKKMMTIELICSSLLAPAHGNAVHVPQRPVSSVTPESAELNAR